MPPIYQKGRKMVNMIYQAACVKWMIQRKNSVIWPWIWKLNRKKKIKCEYELYSQKNNIRWCDIGEGNDKAKPPKQIKAKEHTKKMNSEWIRTLISLGIDTVYYHLTTSTLFVWNMTRFHLTWKGEHRGSSCLL
jgi:hypothetical protein